jgi:CheY-like chemotaxis protein
MNRKDNHMEKVILIVEDNPKNLKLFKDLLRVWGYATIEALDGKQGVELAKTKIPDLILMDIQMPVMDGIEATKILKTYAGTKDIPIVALTSFVMVGDKERILEAGCDGYLAKPIDILTKNG